MMYTLFPPLWVVYAALPPGQTFQVTGVQKRGMRDPRAGLLEARPFHTRQFCRGLFRQRRYNAAIRGALPFGACVLFLDQAKFKPVRARCGGGGRQSGVPDTMRHFRARAANCCQTQGDVDVGSPRPRWCCLPRCGARVGSGPQLTAVHGA